MPEKPRYPSLPVPQEPLFQSGIHVGYRVSVKLQKAETMHEAAVEVITGAEQAATLAAGSIEDFTTWVRTQVEANELVAKANAALDAV